MKKTVKRVIAGSSLAILLSLFSFIVLILYPGNLFAKRMSYREFMIYSDQAVAGNYVAVLDHARQLASKSELYDKDYEYDVFLTEGMRYKDIVASLFGRAMARSQDNNIHLNVNADFDIDRLASSTNWRHLSQTIAHEMVHCLQLNKYGMLTINPIVHPPFWKQEGYPEYIALLEVIHAPDYNFPAQVEALKAYVDNKVEWPEVEPGRFEQLLYFKGRIMIEYLMDVKGMTFDQILQDKRSEDEVYRALVAWHEGQ